MQRETILRMLICSMIASRKNNTLVEIVMNTSTMFDMPFATPILNFREFFSLGQSNIEAVMQVYSVLGKGIEEIGKHIATLIEVECERAAAAAQGAMKANRLQDTIALNTDYAKVSLEHLAANTT